MRVLAGNTYPQQNGRTSPPPDRFHLINGRPETIALKYSTGKPTRYGRVMYTLADGRTAFFEPEVAAEIDALRLAPGQPFTICTYGPGQWDVQYAQSSDRTAAVQPMPGTGHPAPRPQPTPRPAPQPAYPPAAQAQPQERYNAAGETAPEILARCYAQAIDIQAAALDQARSKGLHLTPTTEALQACAATLFIAATRRLD